MMLLMSAAIFFSVDAAARLSSLSDMSGTHAPEPRGAGEEEGAGLSSSPRQYLGTAGLRETPGSRGPFFPPAPYPHSSQLSPSYRPDTTHPALQLQQTTARSSRKAQVASGYKRKFPPMPVTAGLAHFGCPLK